MAKYRTKPCEIEAVAVEKGVLQPGGEMFLPEWARPHVEIQVRGPFGADTRLVVHTLEGDMRASVGDMLVRGLKGEVYPVKPDIFAMKYEPVSGT